ncbi:MAG: T9SS type A sorting domain-containing protein [Bacteroidia bacterium]|nr:T9SS type A sorting domain-containing protein [Bacteroidia bacterium]
MKKIFTHYLLLVCLIANAQFTLQVSSHRPAIGDTNKIFIIDTSAFTIPMPNHINGNNVTWNYSSIINTGSILTQVYVSNTAVPSSTNFSGCNLVLNLGPGSYNYLKTTDTPTPQLELLGLNFGTFAQVTFTNSGVLLRFPASFGSSFTDPASGTFSANTGTSTINGSAMGNFVTSVDGFGTLILGQQTINNVLRLKSTQNFTLFQGFLPLGTIRSTIYSYYTQNEKFPLFQVQYQTLSIIAQTPSTTAAVRMNAKIPLLGLNEQFSDHDLLLYPNPSNDFILVVVSDSCLPPEWELYNTEGKKILFGNLTQNRKIDIHTLPLGIYYLKLKSADQRKTITKKIIKSCG